MGDVDQDLNLTKAERKRLKRQLKKKLQERELKKRKIRNYGKKAVVLVAAAALIFLSYRWITQSVPEKPGDAFPIEGRQHVPGGTKVNYQTNPPTSGDHYGEPADWGVYKEELEDEAVVHSLEHGGIWISYKDIDEETKKKLEAIGKDNSGSVIVSPRSLNDVKIAVVSWGRLMTLESFDEGLIREYIRLNKNRSPEKLAR